MTAAPLTLIDSPVQLDGEIAPAWAWEAEEIGCPMLAPGRAQPTTVTPGARPAAFTEPLHATH